MRNTNNDFYIYHHIGDGNYLTDYYELEVDCPECEGSRWVKSDDGEYGYEKCPYCEGKGTVIVWR